MRDGMTRKTRNPSQDGALEAILANYQASLVVLSGKSPGHVIELKESRTVLGRGPGVDVALDDEAMSRQHFALDATAAGFCVQDLGSTNGILLNGKPVDSEKLKHGDRLKAGDHEFRFLLEEIEREPRTYVVPD